jgi:hypothetical protein
MKASFSSLLKVVATLGILFFTGIKCEQIIQTFTGEVGAGNYTYFTLKREGEITLILDSTEGDADIYVSAHVAKPDFENYDLQSTTCGRDVVTIPKFFERPIGIAIFGHIHSPLAKYTMTVVVDYTNSRDYHSNKESTSWLPSDDDGEVKEESAFWMIFVGIVKIIFEILV